MASKDQRQGYWYRSRYHLQLRGRAAEQPGWDHSQWSGQQNYYLCRLHWHRASHWQCCKESSCYEPSMTRRGRPPRTLVLMLAERDENYQGAYGCSHCLRFGQERELLMFLFWPLRRTYLKWRQLLETPTLEERTSTTGLSAILLQSSRGSTRRILVLMPEP